MMKKLIMGVSVVAMMMAMAGCGATEGAADVESVVTQESVEITTNVSTEVESSECVAIDTVTEENKVAESKAEASTMENGTTEETKESEMAETQTAETEMETAEENNSITAENNNADSDGDADSADNGGLVNTELPDIELKEAIINRNESEKLDTLPDRSPESLATLETIPDSSITYVSVDGYGNACGMGVPFQQYAVGVRANPIEGYKYAGCESETIEFYEYAPNESLGYDVPWFHVPDSGNHVIYVYYEAVE